MKIHLISDVHLDRDPDFAIPADLNFDVLVCAGDVAENPKQAIDFLTVAAAGRPCVFVLGNHDFWHLYRKTIFDSAPKNLVDMEDRLAELKALAPANIHVLENETIVIEAGGERVRFLGCTLWTSYNDADPDFMDMGGSMNDSLYIGAKKWHAQNPGVRHEFIEKRLGQKHADYVEEGEFASRFHQVVALDVHRKSLAWLDAELREDGDWDSSVIVTHHAPSWRVLEASGLISKSIDELTSKKHIDTLRHTTCEFDRMDRDDAGTYRLAAYASPLENFIRKHKSIVSAWCHGHIHSATDIAIHSVRVISNPRRSLRDHPFNERLVFDTTEQMWPPFKLTVKSAIPEFKTLLVEIKELHPHINHETGAIRLSVREAYEKRMLAFRDGAIQICRYIHENLEEDQIGRGLVAIGAAGYEFEARLPSCYFNFGDQEFVENELSNAEQFVDELRIVPRLRPLRKKHYKQLKKDVLAELTALDCEPAFDEAQQYRASTLVFSVAPGTEAKIGWRHQRRHGFVIFLTERDNETAHTE